MHLKALTLKGFKSFAEPASIRLEPGITVVVGPNGSGKSNVVDAVAWVLGAQAPSSVRSARMDDVIFAGTAKRPALGRAEVSLTIDNSDGALPLGLSEVRITRTLFRGGESSYALNGAPCRLLDIAELLSDTGVGRQQHVIVSQSQIDAVLNARPTERREVIEEAAGVLKYRKRRERAERRLLATEGDLTRIGDLLREVRRRLRPLQRQAEAARRHADLLAELQALRIHLAGREIADRRERLRVHKERTEARVAREAGVRAQLEQAAALCAETESRLTRHGVSDSSERLARLEGLKARATGLEAVLGERRRSIQRERAVLLDSDLAASLGAEIDRCRRDLETAAVHDAAAMPARRELARMQLDLEAERAGFAAEWGEGEPVPQEAAEARGERGALHAAIAAGEAERDDAAERLRAQRERLRRLEGDADRASDELSRHSRAVTARRAELDTAEVAAAACEVEAQTAAEALASSEGEVRHWAARRDALALALEKAGAEATTTGVGATDGVLGVLAELVEVDHGVQAAFEAAVGEALHAVVVRDADAARRVLASLEAADAGSAVIALGAALAGEPAPPPAPRSTQRLADGRLPASPLRDRVRSRDSAVDGLLDVLLASAVLVKGDWRAAAEVATRHPDVVVVTAAGDRFSSRGWRLGLHAAAGLRAAHDQAVERHEEASTALAQATDEQGRTRAAVRDHRARIAALKASLADAERAVETAAQARSRWESERRDVGAAVSAGHDHFEDMERRLAPCRGSTRSDRRPSAGLGGRRGRGPRAHRPSGRGARRSGPPGCGPGREGRRTPSRRRLHAAAQADAAEPPWRVAGADGPS